MQDVLVGISLFISLAYLLKHFGVLKYPLLPLNKTKKPSAHNCASSDCKCDSK